MRSVVRLCLVCSRHRKDLFTSFRARTLFSNVGRGSRNQEGDGSDKLLNVSGMRKPYKGKQEVFDVGDLVAKEPFGQFTAWFEEAKNTDGIMEANAMAIATATKDGKPSVRMVLMKGIDKKGIVFYTNYGSRKAQELVENPNCSLMFYWEALMKSIRIEGRVERVSEAESTQYFHSRPRTSQMGAVVSQQSTLIKNREELDKRNQELLDKYEGNDIPIPKPDYWGGFRVVPNRFEFWQGQTNRLHDRIVFRKPEEGEKVDPNFTHTGEEGWVYERLMP
ncbi:pyridoxine/pyridoxamine 5'-phosphate oxidase isoform X2 [Aplysia californica]|uniref:pyridoxal 5'-phosphate synthase n=1 Tax=Aplysia californica TaxID=6500 RepID=A0ABM0K5C9_APLCA|nr:pyridoxine/pyridoxamine 5'-phosphate oxidase isoform X2 [Aplysia californica]